MASALNRADLLQRRGRYPAPPDSPQDIPGLEFAGTITACGDGVTRHEIGDRVMGIVGGGACAEFLVTHEQEILPIPANLAFGEAAAIPEAFITGFDAAIIQGQLNANDWLVVTAGASGVGAATIQIARALGANVIASTRHPGKQDALISYGASVAVVGDANALKKATLEATCGQGANVLVDLVSGNGLNTMIGAIAPKGRVVVVGLLGGSKAELNLGRLMAQRITLIGTVLRSRTHEEKVSLMEAFEATIAPLFSRVPAALRPVIDSTYPLSQIRDAHDRMESNAHMGKIILDHMR
jgi:NADPH2:quinone reductase